MIIPIALVVVGIYLYLKWNYSYWKRKGLEYLEPQLFFGNTKEFLTRSLSFGDQFEKLYNQLKARGLKHGGVFMSIRPVYLPTDLEIIKNILQKDFNSFMNHGLFINEEVDPLTGHLFNLEDEKWRKLRTKLTPTFTSGKMKMMFSTMVKCTEGLEDILKEYDRLQDVIDIKEVVSRFTTDIIGSVAFGIDCNSLKNPDSEFRQFGRKIFQPDFTRKLKTYLVMLVPRYILIKLKYKLTSAEIENFFFGIVESTIRYREENNVYRKDFMHLLLQLKNRGKVVDDELIFEKDDKEKNKDGRFLSVNEIAAQCFVFFLAGFETSATTMTFALLELALNQDIQEKLREEIKLVLTKHNNELTYDSVMDMAYLDQVVHETLRKHPPVPGTPRVCNSAYLVPNTNLTLDVGTRVHIPVQAIQKDPKYYPDPEKFDPERFSEKNKSKRHPFSFLPFGEGPRICIGARFGILQTKVGLISIIRNFKVTLNKKTKVPIRYTSKAFITAVEGDVWLNVSKLE